MIELKKIELFGETKDGEFSSSMEFFSGVNIISAPNGFGKTLISKSIIWALGLEKVDITRDDDPSFMPESIIEKFKLSNGEFAKITRSSVRLTICDHRKEEVVLERAIVGKDLHLIKAHFANREFFLTSNSKKNFSDKHVNLTRAIMEWAGIEPTRVVTRDGNQSWLYLENIASLFYVNQLGGWGDLFASQVRYYGILDVNEITVEYLLGLEAHLKIRQSNLVGGIEKRDKRDRVKERIEDINKFISKFNEDYCLSYKTKSLDQLVDSYKGFSVLEYFKGKMSFDLQKEVARSQEGLENLIEKITAEEMKEREASGNDEVSKKLNEIFYKRTELQEVNDEIQALVFKVASKEQAYKTTETKMKSAEHLKNFKQNSIGFFKDNLCCPTCTQEVNVEQYNFDDLNEQDVERSVLGLNKDLSVLRRVIAKDNEIYEVLKSKEKNLLLDIEFAKKELEPYKRNVSRSKEDILVLAESISEKKTYIKKCSEDVMLAVELSNRLTDAINSSEGDLEALKLNKQLKSERKILEDFEKNYQGMLENIEITLFQGDKDASMDVKLDKDYIPTYRGQFLKKFASASDQSRIILPYVLSILKTSVEKGGNHIGFTLLDEPIQQNPEEEARERIVQFYSELPTIVKGQCLIFTNITQQESQLFDKKNNLKFIEMKRFLTLGKNSF